ncbi:CD40 ligand isoform X2 [Centroberyx affinis]|uniref:CD40 ligand isoform X2 n=1 Tax=Centroberyx affinis TaxID=166261 RepID=UPI003A5C52D4
MINTYQTSLPPPPPVPPRLSRPGAVLIPAPALSRSYSKSLIRFLVGLVLLHLLLSLGGFIYLYHTSRMEKLPTAVGKEKKSAFLSQDNSQKAMARMIVKQPSHNPTDNTARYLEWNMGHSVLRNINYYYSSWLTVLQPGDYYVYARVTFSRWNPKLPLACIVKMRSSEMGEERDVMKAYCSLQGNSSGLCTATQAEVITLEARSQLSVWVQDLSMVNYEEEATTFGMYKL